MQLIINYNSVDLGGWVARVNAYTVLVQCAPCDRQNVEAHTFILHSLIALSTHATQLRVCLSAGATINTHTIEVVIILLALA